MAQEHKEIYERFLNGVLIYRPQEESDEGMIKLSIRDLANPLEGTFDLSQCGNADQYLSISTGYRKEKKTENANKVEVWFALRSLIEGKLKTTATHFEAIYEDWNGCEECDVGIFWTLGGDDNLTEYDYLTHQTMDELSLGNLYENWRHSYRSLTHRDGRRIKFPTGVSKNSLFLKGIIEV